MKDKAYKEALKRIKEAAKTHATELSLSRLGLTELPPEIGQLKKLKEIVLAINQLSTLPPEIGQLKTLKKLYLYENKLSVLPPEIRQLKFLQELDLSDNQLTALPPKIWELKNLKKLDLSYNQLRALPPEIGQLKVLKELNLMNNKFSTFPPEIQQIKTLQSLYLNGNQISTLPPEIGQMKNIKSLGLGENKLTNLPSEISQLKNLQELYLHNNQLTSLLPEIRQFKKLENLGLGENQLTNLPSEIGQLKNLQALAIYKNQLKILPLEITLLNLDFSLSDDWYAEEEKKIFIGGNPLEVPPIEVVRQGREAVVAYFEEVEKEKTTRLYEAKLLIVGQGGVGKTYLMNRLVHDSIDKKTISTEGIDINEWQIKTKQTDNFQINFWDFGGQEIYHATHQFFLTKRSLYLFVWEARTDADLFFEYWLNTIKLYGGDSPVIVIQNKIDERKKLINQESWQQRFPNIVAFHDVSAEQGIHTDELRDSIIQEIEKLPHIGDLLPKRWSDIRKKLEGLGKNYITYSEYKDICSDFGMDEVQTDRLSGYYHHLGVFLHFKDSPVLKNTVFLSPEWATNAVYKIADNQKVKEAFGKFDFCDLGDIWTDRTTFPEDMYVDLIELMKSFELCFELPESKKYIIPELLRARQPEFNWDHENNLRFKYQYYFMPAGIISRFISITHDLIKENLYWKDGVVLQWDNSEALIVKTDNRVIDIWTRGEDKKVLLGIIRRHMAYINSPENKSLEVDEMVPCICHECHDNSNPYFYPYKNLMKARKKQKNSIECQRSFDPVSIEELLGGIERKKEEEHRGIKGNTLKIFLASSAELKEEREKIELFIGKENRRLHYQNIFLDLVIWEDLKLGFNRQGRIQDYFNEKMLECDIVNLMFFKKVGDYTREEFDVAYQSFKEGKNPHYLYVYFKDAEIKMSKIDKEILKVLELKEEIEEAEQIYNSFTSSEDLILQLKNQLDMIIPEMVY